MVKIKGFQWGKLLYRPPSAVLNPRSIVRYLA